MTQTTLERPEAPSPPASRGPMRRTRRNRSGRRVWLVGLALSVVLHGLFFLAAGHLTVVGPPPPVAAERVPRPNTRGSAMRALQIASVPSEDVAPTPAPDPVMQRPRPERTAPPERQPFAEAGADRPASGEVAAGGADARERRLSAAERLQPRMYDRRLWVMPEHLPEKSDIQRARDRISGKIRAINDSLAARAAARREARDWTFTDDQGRRWGISPEGIHLGGITLPAPQFRGEREARERIREWRRIRKQAASARAREVIDQRIEAIRERKDAERAADNGGGGDSGGGDDDGGGS